MYIKYIEIHIKGCRVGSNILNVYVWYEGKSVVPLKNNTCFQPVVL